MKRIIFYLGVVLFVGVSCNSTGDKAVTDGHKQPLIQGMITKISTQSFEDTYATLKGILTANPALKIIAELDHAANAATKGLSLRPTRIVFFGNPVLGTPLMQGVQSIGLDLPQKILVYEDAQGVVHITYNDPMYLKQRHQLLNRDAVLQKIATALDKITTKAAGL